MDVEEALQRSVFAALSNSAEVTAALGGVSAIYDAVPQPQENEAVAAYRRRVRFPIITLGDIEVLDDSSCEEAFDVFVHIDIWSTAVGRVEAKRIGGAVRRALNVALEIEGFVCVVFEFEHAQYPKDRDGITTHGILRFRYQIDPA